MTRNARGLDALIPTGPEETPPVRQLQWRELEAALGHITRAQFEYARGNPIDGHMWLDDARRSLGVLALSLADGDDAEGYARLFGSILTTPESGQER